MKGCRDNRQTRGTLSDPPKRTCCRQPVDVVVRMRHHLLAALAGGVEAGRPVGGVILREGYAVRGPIHRGRRGEYERGGWRAAVHHGLEERNTAGDVGANVGAGVAGRVSDAGLGSQVHHVRELRMAGGGTAPGTQGSPAVKGKSAAPREAARQQQQRSFHKKQSCRCRHHCRQAGTLCKALFIAGCARHARAIGPHPASAFRLEATNPLPATTIPAAARL